MDEKAGLKVNVVLPGAAYFAVVLAAGFFLGTIRVVWLAPRVGVRFSELLELPLMLAVVVFAARRIHARFLTHVGQSTRFMVGVLALVFLLVSEVALGMALRGQSPKDAFTGRDPVSGTAYYLSLGVFMLMPWWLGRNAQRIDG